MAIQIEQYLIPMAVWIFILLKVQLIQLELFLIMQNLLSVILEEIILHEQLVEVLEHKIRDLDGGMALGM